MTENRKTIDESWYHRPWGMQERISAGGIVVRLDDEHISVALVREEGKDSYILPKGHVEAGESLEQAARREVEEEAGFSRLTLLQYVGTKERLDFKKRHWKITHYFLYRTDEESGIPTDPKTRYSVFWFSIDELPYLFWPEQQALLETTRDIIRSALSR